jgi:alkylated DNA repair dioxygenase AlkB
LHYDPSFLQPSDRQAILTWLETLVPLWEQRYSTRRPLPAGRAQRSLLRPVYWLGNWQFACLDYYRPPRGTLHRCVEAEPFPPVLARLVKKMEQVARRIYRGPAMPPRWHLNTCLVNLYGKRFVDGKWEDTARVGEHKDFEPGPVASLSLGERALFQFVESSGGEGSRSRVVFQQWLGDGSLQIFGGDRWKTRYFHRVQRVDRGDTSLPPAVDGFVTRRINFTFRYVPDEHVLPFASLPPRVRDDVVEYVAKLAESSPFFARQLSGRDPSGLR